MEAEDSATLSSGGEVKSATLVCTKSAEVGAKKDEDEWAGNDDCGTATADNECPDVDKDDNDCDDDDDDNDDNDSDDDSPNCSSSAEASASARSRDTYASMLRAETGIGGGTEGEFSTRRFTSRLRREIERAVSCRRSLMLPLVSPASASRARAESVAAAAEAMMGTEVLILAGLAEADAVATVPI